MHHNQKIWQINESKYLPNGVFWCMSLLISGMSSSPSSVSTLQVLSLVSVSQFLFKNGRFHQISVSFSSPKICYYRSPEMLPSNLVSGTAILGLLVVDRFCSRSVSSAIFWDDVASFDSPGRHIAIDLEFSIKRQNYFNLPPLKKFVPAPFLDSLLKSISG